MPVGMKNGTTGSLQVAVDAVTASAAAHTFLGQSRNGSVGLIRSAGNQQAHVILRGGADGPNYGSASVYRLMAALKSADLPQRVVIDASHGNSGKNHLRQRTVAAEIGTQVASGTTAIRGVMLESFLQPGRQDVIPGRDLTFGQSITDACMGWDTSVEVLHSLAAAVRARRRVGALTDWLESAAR